VIIILTLILKLWLSYQTIKGNKVPVPYVFFFWGKSLHTSLKLIRDCQCPFKLKIGGNYIISHELPAIVNMLPRTDTSTIREHSTTIYVPLFSSVS
jgi:hypothetical protein